MNTFPTLLKREFWEHKGGMLWAPVVVGGLMLGAAGISAAIGLAAKDGDMRVNGERIVADGQLLTTETQQQIADGLSFAIIPSLAPLAAVLAFVVLFYALGSLYDDRRDRSVLFWKSMPVSNTATVLSKLASMALVTPLITALVGIVVGTVIAIVAASTLAVFGANVLPELLTTSEFYLAPLAVLAVIPVYALWVLPSIAWCMAVSAWAKRAPFLWAVGTPVLAGILLSWQQAMFDRDLGAEWFWEHIVGRLFGSFLPGMWFAFSDNWERVDDFQPAEQSVFELVSMSYASLSSPSLWIGLAAAAALVAVAIRLRRWREDA
jgi:ABC-2 type transport system permease protein